MSKLNQDQGLMDSILAKEWHTLYAEEIILVMNYAKDQQAVIDNLKSQLNNMERCYIEKKKQVEELQKTNISLEAGLRKNSKNKQKLLGKNIELQKRIDEYKKLTTSIRNEFDLWSDDSEFADVIEAQIENLEDLRGANE